MSLMPRLSTLWAVPLLALACSKKAEQTVPAGQQTPPPAAKSEGAVPDGAKLGRDKAALTDYVAAGQGLRDFSGGVKELKIEEVQLGKGAPVKAGNQVKVSFVGKLLTTGRRVTGMKKPVVGTFVVGEGNQIPGIEEGVVGMSPGGKRLLTVPPHMAFGDSGIRVIIPPGATIVYEIELLSSGDPPPPKPE